MRRGRFVARIRAVRLVKSSNPRLFEVDDLSKTGHYVYARPEFVDQDHLGYWLTVAVCCVDNSISAVLVEFDDIRNGISRLWVNMSAIDYGNTHAFKFPEETRFPVVKVDLNNGCTAWDEKISVVLIERTAEAAQSEADRLNRLHGSGRVIYFWQAAKTSPK
jgi:hypothetical protein